MRTDARTARLAWSSSLPPVARFMPLWYPRDRLQIISAYETGERKVRAKDSAPLRLRVLEKTLDFCSCFYQGSSTSQESHPPTDTYTIY
jgi:hypothetical protein